MSYTLSLKKAKPTEQSSAKFAVTLYVEEQAFKGSVNPTDVSMINFLLAKDEDFKTYGIIELPLTIDQKEFVNDDNDRIKYFEYSFTYQGEEFYVRPSKEDKRLLSYILKDLF